MFTWLLAILGSGGGYESTAVDTHQQLSGYKGFDDGGKNHVADAFNILLGIWKKDQKYKKLLQ